MNKKYWKDRKNTNILEHTQNTKLENLQAAF